MDDSKPVSWKEQDEDAPLSKRQRQKLGHAVRREAEYQALRKSKQKRTQITFLVVILLVAAIGFTVFFLTRDGGSEETLADADSPSSTEPIAGETTPEPITTEPTTNTNPGGDTLTPNYTPYQESDYGSTPCPPEEGAAERVLDFDDSQAKCIEDGKTYKALFVTSEGDMEFLLDTENTPGTANNFIALARHGYYNGTLLFRTDPPIGIIQGGGPHTNSPSDPGPGYNILDEGTGFTYQPGQIVMARAQGLNSASAQFFFAVDEKTSLLDGQGTYVVFGEVVSGLDVMQNILALHQSDPSSSLGGGPSRDVRVEEVRITSE